MTRGFCGFAVASRVRRDRPTEHLGHEPSNHQSIIVQSPYLTERNPSTKKLEDSDTRNTMQMEKIDDSCTRNTNIYALQIMKKVDDSYDTRNTMQVEKTR